MSCRGSILLVISLLLILAPVPRDPQPGNAKSEAAINKAPAYVTTDFAWAMFHSDPAHTGFTDAKAPSSNSLLWNAPTGGSVSSSPVVADGIVLAGSSDTFLYALNESSGGVLWRFKTGGAITGSPAVHNGVVYLGSQDQTIYAVELRTGLLKWSSGQIAPISSSLTVVDGMVLFGTQYSASARTARILSLNSTSGATVWSFNWAASITSSPAADQGRVFVGTSNGWVLAFDEFSGRSLWQYQAGTSPVSSPAVQADYVYVSTSTNRVRALEAGTGVVRWGRNFGGASNPTPSSPAIGPGIVVVGTGGGQIAALDPTTGVSLWTFGAGGAVSSSPAITLDTMLVGASDDLLYALQSVDGTLLWSFATGGPVFSSPALADGLVFFGSNDGMVYAVGPPPPVLEVSVGASRMWLRSGLDSGISVLVTSSSVPETGVGLTVMSSFGSVSPPVPVGSGAFRSDYLAPDVGATVTVTVEAVSWKPGYVSGSGKVAIRVDPPGPMSASLSLDPRSVAPGNYATLILQLMNGTIPVVGANVSAQATVGGSFSKVVDRGDGSYSVSYSPPDKDFPEPIPALVLVAATKPGFQAAFSTGQLVVYGNRPRPVVLPQVPWMFMLLGGVTVSASALAAYWFKVRKRDEGPGPAERDEEFRRILLNSIASASEVVGPNVWNHVLWTLENWHGLSIENVPENLEVFDLGLHETLGGGAPVVERLILKRLFSELDLEFASNLQLGFDANTNNARMAYLYPKKWKKQRH